MRIPHQKQLYLGCPSVTKVAINHNCRDRMILILRGRRFGFSLEEIRQWLSLREEKGTRAQTEVWLEAADRQIVALEDQRRELDDSIRDLKKLRAESASTLE